MRAFPTSSEQERSSPESTSEHDKAVASLELDRATTPLELLELVISSPNVLVRKRASWKITGDEEQWGQIIREPDAIDKLFGIVRNEQNEWVYDPIMRALIGAGTKLADAQVFEKAISFICEVATIDHSEVKRHLALWALVLLREAQNLGHSTKTQTKRPLDHFLRERILTDKSNYVRASTCDHILSNPDLHSEDLLTFAVQWFLHTEVDPQHNHKWFSSQVKVPSYFKGESRNLLERSGNGDGGGNGTKTPGGQASPLASHVTTEARSKNIKRQIIQARLLFWGGILTVGASLIGALYGLSYWDKTAIGGCVAIVAPIAWKKVINARTWWEHS